MGAVIRARWTRLLVLRRLEEKRGVLTITITTITITIIVILVSQGGLLGSNPSLRAHGGIAFRLLLEHLV